MWKEMTLPGALTGLLALAAIAGSADRVDDGGLRGRVLFDGERPKLELLGIAAKASKGCCPEGTQVDATDRRLQIAKDGGLANVVVEIDIPGAEVRVPEKPFRMDNRRCRCVRAFHWKC